MSVGGTTSKQKIGSKEFSVGEIGLLVEALARAASRHESEARFNPHRAKPHDDKAAAMRKLRQKLLSK